jgi:hypothetical protein
MTYKPDDFLCTKDIAREFDISIATVYRRKKEMAMFPRFRSGIYMGGARTRFKELEEFMRFVHTPEYRQELRKLNAVIR